MVWCGVVWSGVVWCGVVWFGVVWCGLVLNETFRDETGSNQPNDEAGAFMSEERLSKLNIHPALCVPACAQT